MKIFVNQKIKCLFVSIALCLLAFLSAAMLLISFDVKYAAFYVLLSGLAISVAILILCYRYFSEQNKIMEDAVSQITGYLSGDKDARIECDDEGQLYRLFHEVNTLVSILNAHAENETNSKAFLKNTISDISHQLKTPLAALNIYNGILQEEAAEFPTIKEFLTLSEQELDRIEALVQSLLKITKLDAGTICLEKSFTSVSQLLESVRNQFLFRAQQENKTITLSEGDDVPFLCDRSWMTEAVGNIVKNALDHMQAGDFVSIAWRTFPSMLQIIIKDNGSGIHPEDMPHILKRFYRSRFSKDTQGIGLGLPLAKAIIEAHSGTIEVDSQPGAGTTFTLTFLIPTKL